METTFRHSGFGQDAYHISYSNLKSTVRDIYPQPLNSCVFYILSATTKYLRETDSKKRREYLIELNQYTNQLSERDSRWVEFDNAVYRMLRQPNSIPVDLKTLLSKTIQRL